MESFAILLDKIPRHCGMVPPLRMIAYSPENPPATKAQLRTMINFGLILSAPFDEAAYKVNDQLFKATVPSFSFIQSGWVCQQVNPGSCEKLYFSYDKSLLSYFDYFTDRQETVMMPLEINRQIAACLEEIFRICSRFDVPGHVDRLDLLCGRMITEFIIADHHNSKYLDVAAQKIIKIASYLDVHFAEDINLNSLISRAGISERTFNRRWHEHFDQPPLSYILSRRINESCRLLMETNLKVFEIANQVGFNDPYYFSRIFKKHTSCTPMEYRISH